jgi:osmotically-inducible protein OsmY
MNAKFCKFFMVTAVTLLALGTPVLASTLDSRIESSAKESYVFKTYLKNDDIKVQSKDGVVTLSGSVSEEYHRSLAQETVTSLPGVKSVDNKLAVKVEGSRANSDTWLEGKVNVTLLFHRSVSATKTRVDVKDGIVTLRGEAASQAQKELTTEYAKDVEGVKDVKNEMIVARTAEKDQTAGEVIDDASITAQVKMTLLFHRSTSVLNTSVSTASGVVTVGGKAKNSAEKNLVTKLVEDVNGVKKVENLMSVE